MRYLLPMLLACTFFLMSACHKKNEQENISVQQQDVPHVFLPEKNRTAKPGAAVSLASENIITLSVNKAKTINILLNAQLGTGTMLVSLNPSKDLQLLGRNDGFEYEFQANASGQYQLSLDVLAVNAGRYYLNLNVTINNAENSSSRTLAVILQTDILLKDDGELIKNLKPASTKHIISLPAQETISNQ